MANADKASPPSSDADLDADGLAFARAWVSRRLRFEDMLGSLERRIGQSINDRPRERS